MGIVLPFVSRTRTVNQRTIDLIKEFEDYAKRLPNGNCLAYLDTAANRRSWSPGYDGLWTIGWGSTGPDITEGTVWTPAYATKRLMQEVNRKAAEVQAYVTYPLNDNQFGALVSLAYNVGTGGIHGILNLVNQGDLEGAANAFLEYNHSDGVVLAGLTRRRYAEKELFEWEVPSEVSSLSLPMQIAQNGQRATVVSGIGAGALWENLGNARQFTTDNAGWILLGLGVVIFGIFKLWEYHVQTSFDKGYYTPPGTKPITPLPPEALQPDPATVAKPAAPAAPTEAISNAA